jgi:hypothetical protein
MISSLDLLAPGVAALFSAHSGALDRLGIHDAGTGLRIRFRANPKAFTDGTVDRLPSSVDTPSSEIVVEGGPSLGKS